MGEQHDKLKYLAIKLQKPINQSIHIDKFSEVVDIDIRLGIMMVYKWFMERQVVYKVTSQSK